MNPFQRELIGSVIRTILSAAAGAGYLAADADLERLVSVLTMLAVGLWSAYQKFRTRQKLVTMGASHGRMSEHQAEAQIARGDAASVTTKATDVPVVKWTQV